MKKLLTAFFSSLPIIFFGGMLLVVVLIFGGSNQQEEIGSGDDEYITNGIAPEIERLRHIFEKYARKEGVYDQLNIIMALTMQESGGRYLDIMQSSESIGLPPNTITNPEYSIQVGIKHFAAVFKKAGGDVRLTLQSYNYGGGFIDFVKKRGGKYTKALALEFSKFQALKLGWRSYGDPNYVDNVFRYLKGGGSVKPVNGAIEGYEVIMNEALKYEGNPYQWAGSTPKTGFDCSGLVQWAYRKAGISLPRTAQEQYGATKKIAESEVVAGDLVFFTGTYQGKFITHVGIYVGDGRMYNSNDSGVQYSDLKKGYWRDHLVSFGRIKK